MAAPKVSRCWAHRPESKDDWSLSVCDDSGEVDAGLLQKAAKTMSGKSQVRLAIPDDAVPGVASFLRRAWKRAGLAAADMPSAIKASESAQSMYDDYYYAPPAPKLDKTDARVGYREAFALPMDDPMTAENGCHNCRFYQWGSCSLVEGTIEANGISDLWTAMPNLTVYMTESGRAFALHDLIAKGQGSWGLMNEFSAQEDYAEAPDWLHYFPAPGVFNHPEYGAIVITQERNQRMLDNFHSGVYQPTLPVDVEHELQLSGAVGWIDDMRMGEDGSLEAHVDWTAKGLELFEQDRFRYFSPTVMPEWPETVTGETIQDVAIGGALCTRPYFKDPYLRPLVASEGKSLMAYDRAPNGARREITMSVPGIDPAVNPEVPANPAATPEVPAATPEPAVNPETNPEVTPVATFALSDQEAQDFRAFQKFGGVKAVEALQTQVAELTKQQRREKFTQMVTGRAGGDDGAPWVGNAEENVAMLIDLAETFGEGSERFKAYVTRERGLAAQQRESQVFGELGGGIELVNGGPVEQIEGLIAEKMAEGKERAVAIRMVMAENPALYDRYRRATYADARQEAD